MRDITRVVAALLALLVVFRDHAIAPDAPSLGALTVACVVTVGVGLTYWREGWVTASAATLGVHYAAALTYGRVEADFASPVVAVLLVAYLEVADLGASVPRSRHVDRDLLLARARSLAVVVTVAAVAATAVIGVGLLPVASSTVLRALGVLGAAAAVTAPYLVARRQ